MRRENRSIVQIGRPTAVVKQAASDVECLVAPAAGIARTPLTPSIEEKEPCPRRMFNPAMT